MNVPTICGRVENIENPCHSLLGMMSASFDENLKIKCTVVNQTIQIHMQINEMGWNSHPKMLMCHQTWLENPSTKWSFNANVIYKMMDFQVKNSTPFVACAGFLSSI